MKMRKLLATTLALVMIATYVPTGIVAHAEESTDKTSSTETTEEKTETMAEPKSNTQDTAYTLDIDKGIVISSYISEKQDYWYTYTPNKDMTLRLDKSVGALVPGSTKPCDENRVDLNVWINSGTQWEDITKNIMIDREIEDTISRIIFLKLKGGTTYYIKVVKPYLNEPETKGGYKIVFKTTNWNEISDKPAKAKTIKMKGTVSNYLEYANDVDIFKFKATKNGKIKINFQNPGGWYESIKVTPKGSEKVLAEGGFDWGSKELEKHSLTTKSFKVKKGKWYYITVKKGGSIGDDSCVVEYNFTFK